MINLLLGFQIMAVSFHLTEIPTNGPFIYENNQVIKQERFAVEELEQHPDVMEFIVKRRAEHFLKTGKETDEELFKRYQLNEQLPKKKIYKDGMTAEIEAEIAKRYGLEVPRQEVIQYKQRIVVERSILDQSIMRIRIVTSIDTRSESKVVDLSLLK